MSLATDSFRCGRRSRIVIDFPLILYRAWHGLCLRALEEHTKSRRLRHATARHPRVRRLSSRWSPPRPRRVYGRVRFPASTLHLRTSHSMAAIYRRTHRPKVTSRSMIPCCTDLAGRGRRGRRKPAVWRPVFSIHQLSHSERGVPRAKLLQTILGKWSGLMFRVRLLPPSSTLDRGSMYTERSELGRD